MHVLLAEADAEVRVLLGAAVERAGHEVTLAADGAAALATIERTHPPLVFVADRLPDMSGLDVCRRVRALERRGSETFVVVMVPDAAAGARVTAALDAGADDFVIAAGDPQERDERVRARLRVTERRMAGDAARRRAESALERAQRLVGIGETSIALQHEINNPLAALLGHASLLEHGLFEPGEEPELLGVIVEQAHRIADVVRRISALRAPDGVEFERAAPPDDPDRPL